MAAVVPPSDYAKSAVSTQPPAPRYPGMILSSAPSSAELNLLVDGVKDIVLEGSGSGAPVVVSAAELGEDGASPLSLPQPLLGNAIPPPNRDGGILADSPPHFFQPQVQDAASALHSHRQPTATLAVVASSATPGRAGIIQPAAQLKPQAEQTGPAANQATTEATPTSSPTVSSAGSSRNSKPPTSFHLFTSLPAELRHQIWQHTFLPRVIEIHASRQPHYAEQGTTLWKTRCHPHPTLLTCRESRLLALKHYRIHVWMGNGRLHLHPEDDMVVVLGEMDMSRGRWLLDRFADRDPVGVGLTRLGLNAACWKYTGVGSMMRSMSRSLFKVCEEFVLVLYTEQRPPEEWEGGVCELFSCEDDLGYAVFKTGKARELWEKTDWMVVGQNRMKVMGLRFINGWGGSEDV